MRERDRRIVTYVENVGESACACLVTMVQGNVLSLTLQHWLTASQTGLLAGTVASSAVLAAKMRRPWVVSVTLGVVTTLADFVVHPGGFSANTMIEAIVTGTGAAGLSYVVSRLTQRVSRMLRRSAPDRGIDDRTAGDQYPSG